MANQIILVTFTPKGDKELINAINKLATAQKTLEKRLERVLKTIQELEELK